MMARKGNQQRNGLHHSPSNHRHTASESVGVPVSDRREKSKAYGGKISDRVELPNGKIHGRSSSPSVESVNNTKFSGNGKRKNKKSGKGSSREKSEDRMPNIAQSEPLYNKMRDTSENSISENNSVYDGAELRDNGISLGSKLSSENSRSNTQDVLTVENALDGSGSSDTMAGKSLGALAMCVLRAAKGWYEKQKPRVNTLATLIYDARDYVRVKIEHAYPIVWTWILHFGKLILLLSMVWLDCSLRGLSSLLCLGTTSFFAVIWCSIISVLAMIGISKMLIIMVIAGLVTVFIGLALAIFIIAIFATIILWMYGSFWTTGLVVFVGGVSYALSHERVALLITTVYSVYCAKSYVGWLGLLFGLNLSFISSDALIHFLKSNINDQRSSSPPEQTRQSQSRAGHFYGEPMHASPADDAFQSDFGRSADRSPGVPSTSGAETELTSEDEIVRLLNCSDHYSVLGIARYETIDASYLKREYRKKAMLVHPDKNMGNEKSAEAFKKLQNAYEVLLDSLKRKTYDDELRREELLNYFRRFQTAPQKNGRQSIFNPGFTHSEAEDEGPHGESRIIACKKCGDFHIWAYTNRSKSRARWCQDCKDFHQAKDGDGWVEQYFQPLLFGVLNKVEPPCAYVCAESRIYDATEWFVCQGMKCPANTHKPSFHVNTTLTSKHNNAKGASSANKGGGAGMPTDNMDETMTEEEFFEWLQNAVQSGIFDGGSTSNESPSTRNGSCSKSGGKKKRKGKKQW